MRGNVDADIAAASDQVETAGSRASRPASDAIGQTSRSAGVRVVRIRTTAKARTAGSSRRPIDFKR